MMLSCADCDNSYDLCRQLGVSSYLVKPLKQSELLDEIVDVLYTAEGPARTESIASSKSAVVAKFHIRPLKLVGRRQLCESTAHDSNPGVSGTPGLPGKQRS